MNPATTSQTTQELHRALSVQRLARTRAMLDVFSSRSSLPLHIVKVTGTSGKGSVCAMLEAGLRGAGLRTGAFTSPHLVHEGERIRIDGEALSGGELERLKVQAGDVLAAASRAGTACGPTFFETMLMLALERFAEHHVDAAVLEVAIGGGTDITSQVPGRITALTSIGVDHAAEIGPTIADIAREKAMLADPGTTLVVGPAIEHAMMDVIERTCLQRQVRVRRASLDGITSRSLGARGHEVHVERSGLDVSFRLPLAGVHQVDNLATVLAVMDELVLEGAFTDAHRFVAGLERAAWPGRLEVMHCDPLCMIDGAHNELAFERLAAFVREEFPDGDRLLVIGASELEKARAAIRVLGPLFARVVLAGGFYKSIDIHGAARALQDELPAGHRSKIELAHTPEIATREVLNAQRGGTSALITGSLYLVGPIRELLLRRAPLDA